MKCNNCGKEIKSVLIDVFTYNGDNRMVEEELQDNPVNAKVIITDKNWCGYELTEEEQFENIVCPYCKKFPFKIKEIQVHEMLHIVCFEK